MAVVVAPDHRDLSPALVVPGHGGGPAFLLCAVVALVVVAPLAVAVLPHRKTIKVGHRFEIALLLAAAITTVL